MICLDCGNMDIGYDENERGYHCNNCDSHNLGKRKDDCKYMRGDGLKFIDLCIIAAYNISTINSTVFGTEGDAL